MSHHVMESKRPRILCGRTAMLDSGAASARRTTFCRTTSKRYLRRRELLTRISARHEFPDIGPAGTFAHTAGQNSPSWTNAGFARVRPYSGHYDAFGATFSRLITL